MKELPIGRQTFSEFIEQDLLYVDKTRYVWELVRQGKFYFLSRPRRFGKSLLLSTLKSFFEGREELFRGLYVHAKEDEWKKHPVVYIDYSFVQYQEGKKLFKESLLNHLQRIAEIYSLSLSKNIIQDAFVELVQSLYEQFGQVVVLIDEYDKPLVDTLTHENRFEENREVLRGLYGSLKGLDGYLRFVMLTGVSRFAKVGVFSGLNNLEDISMDRTFATILGFTQEELERYFQPYFDSVEERLGYDRDFLLKNIREHYNGYSWDGEQRLYNPFSILNFFKEKEFGNYWFSTGTPTFLIDLVKQQKELPENLETTVVSDLIGHSASLKTLPLHALLFQTGYLTVRKIERDGIYRYYHLGYPNREVQHAFTTYLLAMFVDKDEFDVQPEAIWLRKALQAEDTNRFIQLLQSFLADIPARLHIPREAYYHSLVYMLLRLVGLRLLLEKETDRGRIDAVLELPDKAYIIEFKFGAGKRIKNVQTLSAQALAQIDSRHYYEPYLGTGKKIILFGVGFLEKQLDGRVKVVSS
jgi:hypothetical protein